MPTSKNSSGIGPHDYAVIMAGGSGTRLWPMSRRNSPKQFQALFSTQKTMIQMMYDLLSELFPPERILVQTDKKFALLVNQQLTEVPEENILLEPEARDTAPAFGFATATLLQRDPEARIGIFYSDHIINSRAPFIKSVLAAYQSAVEFPEFLTMIGVKPTYPHTGLGYIKISKQATSLPDGEAFYVEKFVEKPKLEEAEKYVKSWEYFWNTGYKVCTAAHLFNLIEKIDRDMATKLKKIAKLMGDEGKEAEITTLYKELPKISFEYFVTEHTERLLVIPADIEWSDIGDWKTLHSMLAEFNGHHVVSKGNHVGVGDSNTLVYSGERLIATLGLTDTIIVDTGDVILVADKNRVLEMKELIDALKDQNKHSYL
ncbi:MAG: sugar phosphate nucleotidyltransferase [bacterium]